MDAFRNAYNGALTANTNLTPASRQAATKNVDAMKDSARALRAALGKKQKGIAEANTLFKETAAMIDATLRLPPSSSAGGAWIPVRDELLKVAVAYEVPVAGPDAVAKATGASTASAATAPERLTDQEVKGLLESIEKKREAFEAALDKTLKNSTIKGERGEVNTNEFFDDLQDQVQRARERFSADYSASSEVLSLLQLATRIDAWASKQPAGFRGAREWGPLATDFRRLSAAYNSALLRPGQQALGVQARRLNDAELVTAAANVEKKMDAFRSAYNGALTANTNLTPASRQAATKNVDAMKDSARALRAALGKKQKGVAEASSLLKASGAMVDATLKLPPDSSAGAAWTALREELSKVALAYEVPLPR
jgi:hypothetical protein